MTIYALAEQFEDTGVKLRLPTGEERPVLKLGERFYVGETLSLVNPNGFGGRVWSAKTKESLQARAWVK